MKFQSVVRIGACFGLAVLLAMPPAVSAHCDGLDGPVVKAARKALETGNVDLVLIWVQKADEAAIKASFEKTRAVRKLSKEAENLADMYFFETLVRIHRAGEGAPYTGLKPAGRDLGPAIPAADRAIESGSETELVKILIEPIREGILKHFREVLERKGYAAGDLDKGRAYVKAYVEFLHYVERIFEAAKMPAHGHFPEDAF